MELDSMETIQAFAGANTWWGESAMIFTDILDLAAPIDQVSFNIVQERPME
jgi:hypothetical protein